jgi:type VI secretion system Hcp family effector
MVHPVQHDLINVYLKIPPCVHGRLHGATIAVLSYDEAALRDNASGQVAGKRQHGPLKIVKEVDAYSMALVLASVTKQVLPTVEILALKTHPSGVGVIQHSVKLSNVTIKAARKVPARQHLHPDILEYEEVELIYHKMGRY